MICRFDIIFHILSDTRHFCFNLHHQHRYVFSNYARDPVNASPPQGIVKLDTLKGTEDSWIGDADQYLSEPLFAKKKGAGEDIFILLVFDEDCRDND